VQPFPYPDPIQVFVADAECDRVIITVTLSYGDTIVEPHDVCEWQSASHSKCVAELDAVWELVRVCHCDNYTYHVAVTVSKSKSDC